MSHSDVSRQRQHDSYLFHDDPLLFPLDKNGGWHRHQARQRNKLMHSLNGNAAAGSSGAGVEEATSDSAPAAESVAPPLPITDGVKACQPVKRNVNEVKGRHCAACNLHRNRGRYMWICPGCDSAWCLKCKPDWQVCRPASTVLATLTGGRSGGRGRAAGRGRSKAAAKREITIKAERGAGGDGPDTQQEASQSAAGSSGGGGGGGTAHDDQGAGEAGSAASGTPAQHGEGRQTHLGEWWVDCPPPPAAAEETLPLALQEQAMWEQIAERPAMPTATWAPRSMATRIGDILTAAMWRLLQAARCHDPVEQRTAGLQLWSLPTLLLRRDVEHSRTECEKGGEKAKHKLRDDGRGEDFSWLQKVRRRCMLAEENRWEELIDEYIHDRELADTQTELPERGSAGRSDAAAAHKLMDKAVRKVQGGCLRAAANMLTGHGTAAGTAATWKKVTDLVAGEVTVAEMQATAREAQEARKAVEAVPRIKMRTVKRKLRVIKSGAQPGPSGWRNSHLREMAGAWSGRDALCQWSQAWANGEIPACTMELWCGALIAPLNRDAEGAKIRPIALGEVLAKFAQAVLVDQAAPALRGALEPFQTSVRMPGGAEVVARTLRDWAEGEEAEAGTALLQVDLRNAYGLAYRSHMLRATAKRLPALAPQLAAQWSGGADGGGHTYAWMKVGDAWSRAPVHRGSWQGAPDSNPVFCASQEDCYEEAGLPTALGPAPGSDEGGGQEEEVAADGEEGTADGEAEADAADGKPVARTAYADDSFLAGRLRRLERLWPRLRAALTRAGHEVQETKCALWLHRAANLTEDDLAALERLCARFKRAGPTLKILGSEGGDGYDTEIGGGVGTADCAWARVEAMMELCSRIREMAAHDTTAPSKAAAWTLLTKSAARALDYDTRLVPRDALTDALKQATEALEATARAILDIGGGPADHEERWQKAWGQMQLPGALGGCGMRTAELLADAAAWAAWHGHVEAVQALGQKVGLPGDDQAARLQAEAARTRLHQEGILVDDDGRVTYSAEAAAEVKATPWGEDEGGTARQCREGGRRLLSSILRKAERLAAARLWARLDPAGKRRHRGAGGQGAGGLWCGIPDGRGTWLPNRHWVAATKLRTGLAVAPPPRRCRLPCGDRLCGKPLDDDQHHFLLCKAGAARLRPHRALTVALAQCLRRGGGIVDIERGVAGLRGTTKRGEDAVMDVTAWWPGTTTWNLLDVTVRYPGASRYEGAGGHPDAAEAGAAEKQRKYGHEVEAIALEPWGRMAPSSHETLRRLAYTSAEASGFGHTASGKLASWRRELEASLYFALADLWMLALSGAEHRKKKKRHLELEDPGLLGAVAAAACGEGDYGISGDEAQADVELEAWEEAAAAARMQADEEAGGVGTAPRHGHAMVDDEDPFGLSGLGMDDEQSEASVGASGVQEPDDGGDGTATRRGADPSLPAVRPAPFPHGLSGPACGLPRTG